MISSEFAKAFCASLNSLKPGWSISGNCLTGPENGAVYFERRHPSDNPGHVDVGFLVTMPNGNDRVIWDCVSGFGETEIELAATAAHIWAATTAPPLLEFKYSLQGEFAEHSKGYEANGFVGWNVICGSITGFGYGDSPEKLKAWWLENPILPLLSGSLGESLEDVGCPCGVKILFGGDGIAEVRLNGDRHESASIALGELPWPRLNPPGFVRSFIMVLHREYD